MAIDEETGKITPAPAYLPVNSSITLVALRGGQPVMCDWCLTDANGGANVSGASIDGQEANLYGGYYWKWNVLEVELLAGDTPSAAVNDVKLYAGQHGNPCMPPVGDDGANVETDHAFTIFKVQATVNEEGANDNYVVKKKTRNDDVVLWTAQNGQPNEKGASDNHVPLTVNLLGPAEFSCKVRLIPYSDHGAEIEIKTAADEAYPNDGATMTGGSHLDLKLYGVTPSTELWDEIIIAKTDKTGEMDCSYESLTVIWIDDANITVRGSNCQGQAETAGIGTHHSIFGGWLHNQEGLFVYTNVDPNDNVNWNANPQFDEVRAQVEVKYRLTPNEVIPNVIWDIKREATGAIWVGGNIIYIGQNDWADDDVDQNGNPMNADEDLTQNPNLKEIFQNDAPGGCQLDFAGGPNAFEQKGKFREWVEVKIGTKWYVCSAYKPWHVILHGDRVGGHWRLTPNTVNEVLPGDGGYNGFAGTWNP